MPLAEARMFRRAAAQAEARELEALARVCGTVDEEFGVVEAAERSGYPTGPRGTGWSSRPH